MMSYFEYEMARLFLVWKAIPRQAKAPVSASTPLAGNPSHAPTLRAGPRSARGGPVSQYRYWFEHGPARGACLNSAAA